jgi:hypothetical protein
MFEIDISLEGDFDAESLKQQMFDQIQEKVEQTVVPLRCERHGDSDVDVSLKLKGESGLFSIETCCSEFEEQVTQSLVEAFDGTVEHPERDCGG